MRAPKRRRRSRSPPGAQLGRVFFFFPSAAASGPSGDWEHASSEVAAAARPASDRAKPFSARNQLGSQHRPGGSEGGREGPRAALSFPAARCLGSAVRPCRASPQRSGREPAADSTARPSGQAHLEPNLAQAGNVGAGQARPLVGRPLVKDFSPAAGLPSLPSAAAAGRAPSL